MSTAYAVITAVGPDKPGLVNAVSEFILKAGGNVEDSRMAVLGGEFAMLILVSGSEATIRSIRDGASVAGEKVGLSIQARNTSMPGVQSGKCLPFELEAFALDHPGIVQKIASYLAERQINVRALDTRLTHAPLTGVPMFSLHATIDVPTSQKVSSVRRDLEALAEAQNIDIELRPYANK